MHVRKENSRTILMNESNNNNESKMEMGVNINKTREKDSLESLNYN